MKIQLLLMQTKIGKESRKNVKNYFKLDLCHSLFSHYLDRIKHYRSVEATGLTMNSFWSDYGSQQNIHIFCCDLGPHAKNLTSEALAEKLRELENRGVPHLQLLLGPPNGFSDEDRQLLQKKSCFFWSLGAQTLPHDLAAVVAAEQVYRAFTILKGEPYHCGHL